MAGKPWHTDPRFKAEGAALRASAYSTPTTRCTTCGLTLEQARRKYRRRVTWHADHIHPSQVGSPLRIRCSYCNQRDGARMTNAKRSSGYDW